MPAGAEEVVVPALLRAARGAYGDAVRARLAAAGFDDLPRNGPYILGGMANRAGSAGDLVRELGISKQAASQLIDALVLRGYLERAVDPADRRRLTIALTDRGRAAAAAVRAGVEEVDEALARPHLGRGAARPDGRARGARRDPRDRRGSGRAAQAATTRPPPGPRPSSRSG